MMRGWILGCIGWAMVSSCSLLLDKRADQCSSDGDCARFVNSRCDDAQHLCVASRLDAPPDNTNSNGGRDAASESGDSATYLEAGEGSSPADPCLAGGGCYSCPPTKDLDYENACTTAQCHPFDNRARLRNLPDGGLRPLPN